MDRHENAELVLRSAQGLLLKHIRQVVPEFPKEGIAFQRIGKHSLAHDWAYGTYAGREQADRIISTEELLGLV